MLGAKSILMQFRAAQHRGENVVEIVGHAARQRADGLHFLRPAQFVLQPPEFRSSAPSAQVRSVRKPFTGA